MHRRRLLSLLGGSAAVGLAGCAGRGGGDGAAGGTTVSGDRDGGDVVRGPRGDVSLPVDSSEIEDVLPQDRIPAISGPKFGEDWSDTEYTMADDWKVIGVVREGEARAYPLKILNWHEMVNDDFGGPLLVTFCPLCGTGVTAVRKADGDETMFGVSGKLWRSDLVMYDEKTGSLWSQILATAIRGDLTGEQLTLVPSTLTTWAQWQADHPDTQVLLPPPESATIVESVPRNYDTDPYAGYESNRNIGVTGDNDFDDDRLHPKTQVIGVATETAAKAYPFERVAAEGVVNDTVGDLPVVVAAGAAETLSAFERTVDGTVLEFEPDGEDRMRAGGSSWTRTTGRAVDGPYKGVTLDSAARVSTEFWFAWLNFHPDTTVYGEE